MNGYEDPDKFARHGKTQWFEPRGDGLEGGLPFVPFGGIDDRPAKRWLVKGLLGAGELSALFGAPGSGKSVLAGDLAFAVATGLPWFGKSISPGGVLYVAAERGGLVLRRFAALREKTGKKDLPLWIVPRQIDIRLESAAVIATAKHLERKTGLTVQLVIVDTLAQTLAGGDENAARDMGEALTAIRKIQEKTGAHVMIVHHSPIENGGRLRGHSSFLGAVDTAIAVTKKGRIRRAEVVKANDSEEGEALEFDLASVEIATNDEGDVTAAPVVVPAERNSVTGEANVTPSRLPAGAELARRALEEAVIAHGKPPPSGKDYPSGVLAVPVETWRETAFRMGLGDGSKTNRRLPFKRAKDVLQERRVIGIWDDLVWLVKAEGLQ